MEERLCCIHGSSKTSNMLESCSVSAHLSAVHGCEEDSNTSCLIFVVTAIFGFSSNLFEDDDDYDDDDGDGDDDDDDDDDDDNVSMLLQFIISDHSPLPFVDPLPEQCEGVLPFFLLQLSVQFESVLD